MALFASNASFAAAAPLAPAAAAVAPTVALPGQQQALQYTNPPLLTQSATQQARYSQQVIDNRTDITVNQPIINNRDHYVNNINTQVIRDNNFYHYHQQNLVRDNVINTYQNQVLRQQNNFSDYSQSFGRLPGTVSNINYGTSFGGWLGGAAAYGGAAAWGGALGGWAGLGYGRWF